MNRRFKVFVQEMVLYGPDGRETGRGDRFAQIVEPVDDCAGMRTEIEERALQYVLVNKIPLPRMVHIELKPVVVG